MEHLDLAGYITTPTTHWTLPVFEQQGEFENVNV